MGLSLILVIVIRTMMGCFLLLAFQWMIVIKSGVFLFLFHFVHLISSENLFWNLRFTSHHVFILF